MNVNERLLSLRKEMKNNGIHALIIPSSDPHQSEYVADHWSSRAWISGFTGSAGTVVVTEDHAGLWTDSRYFLQAAMELSRSEFILHKVFNQGEPDFIDWICSKLPENSIVGIDGLLFSKNQFDRYQKTLKKSGISMEASVNLFPRIWHERKAIPMSEAFELAESFSGESRASKIAKIRAHMEELGTNIHFISTLDDIAWILNVRGTDVIFNPVVISYLIIEEEQVIWFIDDDKVPFALMQKLSGEHIETKPYDQIQAYLNNLKVDDRIYVDPSTCSVGLYKSINAQQKVHGELISRSLKARKNVTELQHFNKAMEKDGVALVNFCIWLEHELNSRSIREFEVVEKLAEFRAAQGGYHGESFGAIVGYKGNGAIIHYSPNPNSSAKIRQSGILLIDSGGQYDEGTTDITRTFTLGDTTDEQRKAYTLVLQGHVALALAKFPKGTTGVQLDALARMPLWQNGMNYLHGTGHGVGYFLNVHEPTQGFTAGPSSRGNTPLELGMVTSNEPGFYKTDAYGIRIENLVVCVEDEMTDFGAFFKFDTITLFPFEPALIDPALLSKQELTWINAYNKHVFDRLSPKLENDKKAWLEQKCKEIG